MDFSRLLGSFGKEYIAVPLTSALLVFISFGQTLDFYFYHDDYTHIYKAQNHIQSSFPYQLFSAATTPLYNLFRLNPFPYHLIGMLLYWVSAQFVYILLKQVFRNKWVSFLGVVIFSSGYVGQGSQIMFLGDGVGTLTVLPLVIVLLITFLRAVSYRKAWLFAFSYLLTFLVLELSPHRYAGLIIPLVLLDWLFWFYLEEKKKELLPTLGRNILFLGLFYLEFVLRPTNIFWGTHQMPSHYIFNSTEFLDKSNIAIGFSNLWNFFFPSYVFEAIYSHISVLHGLSFTFVKDALVGMETVMGLLLASTIGVLAAVYRRRETCITIILLMGLLVFYYKDPSQNIGSDYRYFMSYAFVPPLFLSFLLDSKNSKSSQRYILISATVMVCLRLVSAIQTQREFGQIYSSNFKNIHEQLTQQVKVLNTPAIMYFEGETKELNHITVDAFRIGELKPQAAVAVHYNVLIEDLVWPETFDEIAQVAAKNHISKDSIYAFTYDGYQLKKHEF